MLTMSTAAATAVTGSWVMKLSVESWLGTTLLANDIPVESGFLEVDRSLRVPERVTLTVPRQDGGTSWDAQADPSAPLASYGQRLRVSVGVDLGPGGTEWLQRGWFTVHTSATDGDTVNVEAVGLLGLIDEAQFVAAYQPSSGTFVSALRDLCEPALTVDTTHAPTDRAVPGSLSWDQDRLAAVQEVLDAWPADAYVSSEGTLKVVSAADSTSSVLSLTDGAGGTVVQWQGSATRDGAATCVVASGQTSDGGQIQGVVYDSDPTSPVRYGGPFNPLPVPYYYYSPLLTTVAQCRSAAGTILARLRRSSGRKLTATTVPHPGLEVGDLVTVTGSGLIAAGCIVEALSLPLTPDGGPMTLSLRVA